MTKTIVGCGSSNTYGDYMPDGDGNFRKSSKMTWPFHLASALGMNVYLSAIPGQSASAILRNAVKDALHVKQNGGEPVVVAILVGLDRTELIHNNCWINIGNWLLPKKFKPSLISIETNPVSYFTEVHYRVRERIQNYYDLYRSILMLQCVCMQNNIPWMIAQTSKNEIVDDSLLDIELKQLDPHREFTWSLRPYYDQVDHSRLMINEPLNIHTGKHDFNYITTNDGRSYPCAEAHKSWVECAVIPFMQASMPELFNDV